MVLTVVALVAAVGLVADVAVEMPVVDEAAAVDEVLTKRRRIQGIILRRNGRSCRTKNAIKSARSVIRKESRVVLSKTFLS